jgi:hypothetical protein
MSDRWRRSGPLAGNSRHGSLTGLARLGILEAVRDQVLILCPPLAHLVPHALTPVNQRGLPKPPGRFFYLLFFLYFEAFSDMAWAFSPCTLQSEGVLHRGSFDSFFLRRKCRIYGGPELPEAVNALRLPTISMGSTEEF